MRSHLSNISVFGVIYTGLIFCLCAGSVRAMDQAAADNLAQALLAQSGRHCAMIAVPHCGSGELAVSFWNQGGDARLIVDAFENDPTLLASAQQKVNSLGLLGRNMYVRSGSLATNAYALPYADHFCDLVCITGLVDTNFNTISYAELERVLCTGAKAWIGRATVEGAGLATATLTNWIAAAGTRSLSSATVVNDASGTWVMITKISRLANTYEGDGSHGGLTTAGGRFYNDKVATWPTLPQWFVKPYGTICYEGRPKQCLWGDLRKICVGGGRMFGFDNYGYVTSKLCAFRAHSGQLLWQVAGLSGDIRAFSQGVVYIPNPYTNAVIYAGETGIITNTFPLSGAVGVPPWSAVESNIFYAVLCKAGTNTLFAYNLVTGSPLYRNPSFAENHVLPGSYSTPVVMADGKIYSYSGTSVYCYSASDGMIMWGPVTVPEAITKIQASPNGVLIQSGSSQANLYFLSVADGTRRWGPVAASSHSGGGYYDIIQSASLNDFNSGNEFVYPISGSGPIDLLTGNYILAGGLNYNCGSCGPGASSTPAGTFARRGGMEATFAGAGGWVPGGAPYPSACQDSPFAASGMTIYKTTCGCYGLFRGTKAEAPMGTFHPEQMAVESERLERGPAYTNLSVQVLPDAKDWPTHRANNNRSAYSPAKIATGNCVQLWKYTNSTPNAFDMNANDHFYTYHDITPPVTAGGYTFIAGSDGIVKCLDNASGSNVWNYATGGWIFATPTVANGCVYVGSGDGYAYCIEAHTGKLVWRFRAAPAERRFNYFGHLISPWPILTGVLVHTNGLAYFVSGMVETYGVQAYAVDSRTGSLTNGWQNTSAGVYLDNRPGLSRKGLMPGGYMTIIGSNLWVKETIHGYFNMGGDVNTQHGGGVFNLQTGAISANDMVYTHTEVANYHWTGRQIAKMGNYVVGWGEDIHTEMQMEVYGGGVSFTKLDASGNPVRPFLVLGTGMHCFAWDDVDAFIDHAKFDLPVMKQYYDATISNLNTYAYPVCYTNALPGPTTDRLWRAVSSGGTNRATALTANCLIEVNSAGNIGVMDRTTGSQLFQVSSGGEPYLQSLAIDRSGKIIVANRNGDVVCYGTTNTVIVTQPTDVSGLMNGQSATFRVEAIGLITYGSLSYQWRHTGVNINGATQATYTIHSVANNDVGGYDVVVSNLGGSATSAMASLSLVVSSSITSPVGGTSFVEPANITIRVTASSALGCVTNVVFYQGSTRIGQVTTAPYGIVWSNVAGGSYSLTAVAFDDQGNTGSSLPVNITVAGLLAHLPFDDGSANIAINTSGRGSNAVLTNGTTWATQSLFNGGVHFNGSTSSSYCGGTGAVTLGVPAQTNSAFTVGFWMNPDLNGFAYGSAVFACKDSGANHSMLCSWGWPAGWLRLQWSTTTGTTVLSPWSDEHAPAQGTWYHYAFVATPSEVDWYVNGAFYERLTPPLGQTMMTSYTNFVIGNVANFNSYSPAGFQGIMDELKVYDHALNAVEIMNLYTNVPFRIPPTISIISPTNSTVITSTNCVSMTVNATVSHCPLKVVYYQDGMLIGTNASAPYNLTWSNAPRGTHNISAVAMDGLYPLSPAVTSTVTVTFATVTPPTISLASGIYFGAQNVSINCADSNALIYYTTNGSDPTMNDQSIASGQSITVGQSSFPQTIVLKVRTFENGMYPSEIQSVVYRIGGALSAGNGHSTVLKSSDSLWSWGFNNFGQLGDATTTGRAMPVPVGGGLNNVVSIGDGCYHSVAVKNDGTVWAWGYNYFGQLGNGTTQPSSLPGQVAGLTRALSVAGGYYHSLALQIDGTVWSWGQSNYGQLGDGTLAQRNLPVQVSGLSQVTAIAAGLFHSLALTSDGTAWSWGYNCYGQLGNGTITNTNLPVQVSGLSNGVSIAGGGYHSLALQRDGTIWAWGYNTYGQLGNGTKTSTNLPVQVWGLSNVVAIAGGYYHSLALRNLPS